MQRITIIIIILIAIVLAACDHPMSFHTKVNEDGSLDKTIILEKAELSQAQQNIFGINKENGWSFAQRDSSDSTTSSSKDKYLLEFTRHFENADQLNAVLDQPVDTLFQVHSTLEKKFRWFYTYLRYSETIRPINRFEKTSPNDFFTPEDSLFIQRLPAEGKKISNADSVGLILLNEKIFDHYSNMALLNEVFPILVEVVAKYNTDKKWIDTLYQKKESIYEWLSKESGDLSPKKIASSLHIPLPEEADHDFDLLSKDFNSRVNFMSFARDGKYTISFDMPWTITSTNADSVNGNYVVWKPVIQKFAFYNYEMYAESRKLNLWAVIVSVVVIVITIFILRKK